jgi:hypothetical protein
VKSSYVKFRKLLDTSMCCLFSYFMDLNKIGTIVMAFFNFFFKTIACEIYILNFFY